MLRKKYISKKGKIVLSIGFLLLFVPLLCAKSGQRAYNITMPKRYKVHGIDVSRYQGDIDWNNIETMNKNKKNKVKISFAFIKATEGRTVIDPNFKSNWEKIEKTNIIRGAYHYFIPTRNAAEQAENFIANVKLKKGDLPPVLDVEQLGNQGDAKLRENVKIWLDIVEKHYGVKPIIYSSIGFYEKHLKGGELKKYPLWIAHYYEKKLTTKDKWIFWQHSDKGEIPGIKEKVDFNVFNGSMKKLKKLCKK